jgi:hypothetical protein
MARTLALSVRATVVLDSSGSGIAEIGPSSPGEIWFPSSTSITCTGDIPQTGSPTVFIYAGNGISPAAFIDSTYNVTGASSSMIDGKAVHPGQLIIAVWTQGPASQTATLAVNGTRQVPLWVPHLLIR